MDFKIHNKENDMINEEFYTYAKLFLKIVILVK